MTGVQTCALPILLPTILPTIVLVCVAGGALLGGFLRSQAIAKFFDKRLQAAEFPQCDPGLCYDKMEDIVGKTKRKSLKESESGKDKTTSKPLASQTDATVSTYADGRPFDRVQYLEAKLILKPDRFTSCRASATSARS